MWQEWVLMLFIMIFNFTAIAAASFRAVPSIVNLIKFGGMKESVTNALYIMPGDFYRKPTQEELDAVDPTKPKWLTPYEKKIMQGIFWFGSMIVGPSRVALLYDCLMIFMFMYLGYGYVSSFFLSSILITIPVELVAFIIYP